MKKISTRQKITLILSGLFLCVVLLEAGLRIGGFIYLSLQEYRNRISIQRKGTYLIMCLGESTTVCGRQVAYPYQLEEILNQRDIGIKFSVINKGRISTDTGSIVSQLEDNLNRYSPDMVIVMMGINDPGEAIAYQDIITRRTTLFLVSLRTYKLAKLIRLHIVNKAREIGIYKSREREQDISIRVNTLTQPAEFKDQEKMLKKSIEINPKDAKSYIELGWCYIDQVRYDKSEEMFKKAIEINPKYDEAYVGLGGCYRYQEKHDKSEEMFKKAIEINPGNLQAHIELGWCYGKHQGRYDKAEEILKKAILITPGNDNTYLELGWCYWYQGEYDKAEEMFKKAIEINPRNNWAYGSLAYCYKEWGRNELAEEYFRKADRLRSEYYNPITRHNYQRLKEIVINRGIKLICVQYPVRSVEPLKKMLEPHEGIIFVDSEQVFKEAIKQASYGEYFTDMFAGDFGHCNAKGHRLLAENIADVMLKECFNK